MEKERWEKVQQVFEEALSLDPKAREAYLAEACGDDQKLLEQVKSLIDTQLEASQYFQRLEGDLAEAMVESDFYPLQPGQRIGSYEVVRRIAAGGMSVIYEARRVEGDFDQRLVIKVLKKGLDTADILRRFRSEKQILARLNHPAIAQIFDGGITEDGTPYFVMEYIDGNTLTEYVKKNEPNLEERLSLFHQIGEALQFAHRNLVIHRDLKPSNILVTKEGRPKLLDFGIAKLLEPEDFNLTRAETQAGDELLTPDYASPEQLAGATITTSTDIYQMGLVLYELLVQQKPFEFKGLSYQERRALIQTVSPEAPSQRNPSTTLSRKIKGELDTIVLMALRKEPERRYLSVEQFLADIHRFQNGRPILAKKDTWHYRLSKFYQRNRFPAILSMAALTLVAMLSVIYTTRITKERDRAQTEARKAQRATEFMQGLFYQASELTIRGEAVSGERLLELGLHKLDTMQAEPSLKAYLYQAVGLTFMGMGLEESAEEPLLRSLELRPLNEAAGQREMDVCLTLGTIAFSRGLVTEADSLLQASLQIGRKLAEPEYSSMINLLVSLVELEIQRENYEQAEVFASEAETMALARADTNSEFYANVLFAKGYIYIEKEELKKAEKAMGDMRQLALRMGRGQPTPLLAGASHNYAEALARQGKLRAAIQYEEEAVQAYQSSIQAPSNYYIDMLKNLGDLYMQANQLDQALAVMRDNLSQAHFLYQDQDPPPPKQAALMLDIANLFRLKGQFDSAMYYAERSFELEKQLFEPGNPELAITQMGLGQILMDKGQIEPAKEVLDSAYQILIKHYKPNHSRVRKLALVRAELSYQQEDYAQATGDCVSLLASYGTGADHLAAKIGILNLLYRIAWRQGKKNKARDWWDQAMALLDQHTSDQSEVLKADLLKTRDALQ